MNHSNDRTKRNASTGPSTLISQGSKLEGILTGKGNFIIDGEIEGECNVDGTITLAQRGHCTGVIQAADVIVAGTVDGDIIATGQVEIGDTAKITGSVFAEAISVQEGAIIDGAIKTAAQKSPQDFAKIGKARS